MTRELSMKKEVDISENVASGELDHVISVLSMFRERGFDRLYWDAYDSTIHLYKTRDYGCTACYMKSGSNQCEER